VRDGKIIFFKKDRVIVMQTVGFIGLGNMGKRMAERLIRTGQQLRVYDINTSVLKSFQDLGAEIAASPSDVAAGCSVIITMLPNAAIVEEVVLGHQGIIDGVKPGTIYIDMSSSSPAVVQKLADRLGGKGASMIDAPVSGGVLRAADGTLSIMAGGDDERIASVKPLLGLLGDVVHVGQLGSGYIVKSLNNLLLATNFLALCEVLISGSKLGVETETLLKVINNSSGKSYVSERSIFFPRIMERNFEVVYTNDLMYKDLGIAMEITKMAKVPTFLGSNVHHFWEFVVGQGGGPADFTSTIQFIEQWAKYELKKADDASEPT